MDNRKIKSLGKEKRIKNNGTIMSQLFMAFFLCVVYTFLEHLNLYLLIIPERFHSCHSNRFFIFFGLFTFLQTELFLYNMYYI